MTKQSIWLLLVALAVLSGTASWSYAAQLQLTWTDNSNNESGFQIDRKTGSAGAFAQLASVGADVTSYTDSSITAGTTYCYRLSAFNTAGSSSYTPEVCSSAPVATYTLVVAKAGAGTGTVTSGPAGINCGSACSATYNSGTAVTLTAAPAAGSIFAGWTGTGCSATTNAVTVTLGANSNCTATFNIQTYSLVVAKAGTGSGTVTSSPAGINCGSACSATYNSGTAVTLTAAPAAGSIFAGWTGTGCSATTNAVTVTLGANSNCTATFNLQTYSLVVAKAGTGSGAVTSSPAGINCGTACSATYNSSTAVTLTAAPAVGSIFAGWTGAGCSASTNAVTVTLGANSNCTATFNIQTYNLVVAKAGSGTGSVTSSPAGINCGSACSATYNSGTAVTLTAAPAAGSIFAGWTGTGCSATTNAVTVTLGANSNCTATFNSQTYNLVVAKAGTGTGSVTSSPAGINCGSACSAAYNSGTAVTLTAAPAAGSIFAGWTGTGCSATTNTVTITLGADSNCTATFNLQAYSLVVAKAGTGSGSVTSSPAGINCGSACSATYNSGTAVTLTAVPAAGSIFAGWTGSGCSATTNAVTVTLGANSNCTATFDTNPALAKIGVFRPSTGQWFLDSNGNGLFDGCGIDTCVSSYGSNSMTPVVADWDGSGYTSIGTFDRNTGNWHLDNGNGKWDACEATGDICVTTYGSASTTPVVRELNADKLVVGTFRGKVTTKSGGRNVTKYGVWNFDLDGDGNVDLCGIDQCIENFGQAGDRPIIGDWDGSGSEEIGVFRPSNQKWYLDFNGTGKWDSGDKTMGPFGASTDLPVVGDWDGTGKVRIGVYRPSTGEWLLDMNGNGTWDASVDKLIGPFGQVGDLPVVGKWKSIQATPLN